MPMPPEDGPLAALRDETIDRLIVNYGHGELSLEAFERRLDHALEAREHAALLALTEDLPLAADPRYAEQKREQLGLPQSATAATGKESDHLIHVFGGGNRSGAWTVAKELTVINVFGGGDIDFSNARFSAPVTYVRLLCLFGGANLYVNDNVNVTSRVVCVFGGVDNRAASDPAPGGPTIEIEGLVLFGGASVKIKRTLKERWLAFADQVRQAFGPLHHQYRNGAAPR